MKVIPKIYLTQKLISMFLFERPALKSVEVVDYTK